MREDGLKGILAMMLHKHKNYLNKLLITTASTLFISAALTSSVSAFGQVRTKDSGANRNTAEIAASTADSAAQEQRQTQLEEDQLNAIGEAGAGNSIITRPAFSGIGSGSDFYSNMEKFGFDMCAVNLCQVGKNPADTTDIEEAREWANKTFFSSVTLSNEAKRDLQEVRRRAVAYTASNALAVSTTIHNELSAGGGSAQALEDIVNSASSLRQDVQASSSISLAQYKVSIQQLAVLSALLDVKATTAMQSASLYHEDGGDEFPDAFIDTDYRNSDLSVRSKEFVTPPQKGSPN